MSTQLMPRAVKPVRTVQISEPTVQQIITNARAKSELAPARGAWLLASLTAGLLWASFTPLDFSPLAWVALVPMLLLVRIEQRTRWMYRIIYATGLLNTLVTLQWMRLGDPAMYIAWGALAIYTAAYFPMFVALARTAVHRYSVPFTFAVPAVWVGLEFVRAHLMTGFAWYFLGHTQYRWTELIQISDLFGAYGVSFVVAMLSASLALLVPGSVLGWLRILPAPQNESAPLAPASRRRQWAAVLCGLCVFSLTLGYGYFRRAQADFQPGPRVALIQGDFDASLKHQQDSWNDIHRTHRGLTGLAVQHQPDLIIWPETMFRWPFYQRGANVSDEQLAALKPNYPGLSHEEWLGNWKSPLVPNTLNDLSAEAGTPMMIGIETVVAEPTKLKTYNSAVLVHPNVGPTTRYDKQHLVIFGEYVPLEEELPWLRKLTPFPEDWGLTLGEAPAVFRDRDWTYAPIICFEDTVPHLVRDAINAAETTADGAQPGSGKPVDCLVNFTNDGWFHGSSELDQHLITASFRAVENRTPLVRAVNTGISAFIDGDGVIREPEVFIDGARKGRDSFVDPETGRWRKRLNAVVLSTVPLDNRTSLYTRFGDWFAALCALFALAALVGALLPRRQSSKNTPPAVTSPGGLS